MRTSLPRSDQIRHNIKTFYDTYGWRRDPATGRYCAEILHEDLSSDVQRYMRDNELRYRKYFQDGGAYFLDAGCGGEPRLEMGKAFRTHVCADLSFQGLHEARKLIGARGRYVVADLAHLPFKDGVFGGVLASHSLYHMPPEDQPAAIGEFRRTAVEDAPVVIFYTSAHNFLSWIHRVVLKIAPAARRLTERGRQNATDAPELFSFSWPPQELASRFPGAEVTCLRTLTLTETRLFHRCGLLKPLLWFFSGLEKKFSRIMVRIGKYTAIRTAGTAKEEK
ncbi:MAG TPA: class I SAM-dependent methyltransferase [Verrucomicrobiae bacterium]|jgi:ubiquinone/menaquinone biosynthesis C-methylase UbiE|nr:class I SAM-dependent methyltransferase [Verrucomicrobiae bacterium]